MFFSSMLAAPDFYVLHTQTYWMCAPTCLQRTTFVWGGCMLLRADSLRPGDKYGILQVCTCVFLRACVCVHVCVYV